MNNLALEELRAQYKAAEDQQRSHEYQSRTPGYRAYADESVPLVAGEMRKGGEFLRDVARGAGYLPLRAMGAATDIGRMVTDPLGITEPGRNDAGTSDWLIDKAAQLGLVAPRTGSAGETLGDVAGQLATPGMGPGEAAALSQAMFLPARLVARVAGREAEGMAKAGLGADEIWRWTGEHYGSPIWTDTAGHGGARPPATESLTEIPDARIEQLSAESARKMRPALTEYQEWDAAVRAHDFARNAGISIEEAVKKMGQGPGVLKKAIQADGRGTLLKGMGLPRSMKNRGNAQNEVEELLYKTDTLPERMDNPDLYRYVPELKDITLKTDPGLDMTDYVGRYIPDAKRIEMRPGLSDRDFSQFANHEVQHGVQNATTTMSRGGNPSNSMDRLVVSAREGGIDPMTALNVSGMPARDRYLRIGGEWLARLMEGRLNMDQATRIEYPPFARGFDYPDPVPPSEVFR